MSNRTDLDIFIDLSKVLTAETRLDRTLAEGYLERLKTAYPGPMQDLLDAFRGIASDRYDVFEVKRRVVDNSALQPLAQQVIMIWYTSQFTGSDEKVHPGKQDEYYHGFLWQVIQAHAPTHSTEEYGYWTHAPDSQVESPKEG